MHTLNKRIHSLLSFVSISLFILLVIDVVLGVASRYIIGDQIRWTEELATFLLVWLVFCGAAIAYRDKAHLGINLLVEKLHPSSRRIIQITALLVVLAFTVSIMLIGGTQLVMERFHFAQMMSTLGIQKAWLYLALPFSGFFITLFNLEFLIEAFHLSNNHSNTSES